MTQDQDKPTVRVTYRDGMGQPNPFQARVRVTGEGVVASARFPSVEAARDWGERAAALLRNRIERDDYIPALPPGCGSWVVVSRETGKAIGEYFERRSLRRFDPDKVHILTALAWLQRVNEEARQ